MHLSTTVVNTHRTLLGYGAPGKAGENTITNIFKSRAREIFTRGVPEREGGPLEYKDEVRLVTPPTVLSVDTQVLSVELAHCPPPLRLAAVLGHRVPRGHHGPHLRPSSPHRLQVAGLLAETGHLRGAA